MTRGTSTNFSNLLKVVAIVDDQNPQVQVLLKAIAANGYKVEVAGGYRTDEFEDSFVGAYIIGIDEHDSNRASALEELLKTLAKTTPSWVLADTYSFEHLSHFRIPGEVTGVIALGQQTPAFYAEQVTASLENYGMNALQPVFGN